MRPELLDHSGLWHSSLAQAYPNQPLPSELGKESSIWLTKTRTLPLSPLHEIIMRKLT